MPRSAQPSQAVTCCSASKTNNVIELGKRFLADERVRFLAVGGFNTAFGFLIFVLVNLALRGQFAGHPAWASVVTLLVSHLIASIPAFVLYRMFVFKVSGRIVRDFFRFQSVYVIPLTLNLFALPFLVWLGLGAIVAQAIIVCVNVVINYVGHKYFSFKRKPVEADPSAEI